MFRRSWCAWSTHAQFSVNGQGQPQTWYGPARPFLFLVSMLWIYAQLVKRDFRAPLSLESVDFSVKAQLSRPFLLRILRPSFTQRKWICIHLASEFFLPAQNAFCPLLALLAKEFAVPLHDGKRRIVDLTSFLRIQSVASWRQGAILAPVSYFSALPGIFGAKLAANISANLPLARTLGSFFLFGAAMRFFLLFARRDWGTTRKNNRTEAYAIPLQN